MLCEALLLYDIPLAMSREIDCIWSRRFSTVTAIYFLQRYIVLFQYVLEVIIAFWVPHSTAVSYKLHAERIESLTSNPRGV